MNIKLFTHESEKYILLNDGVTYDFEDAKDCVDCIIEEYNRNDICMYDLLANIKIIGLTAEETINVYAQCLKLSNNDTIIHIRDDISNQNRLKHRALGLSKKHQNTPTSISGG